MALSQEYQALHSRETRIRITLWVLIPALLLVVVRTLLWHQYFDESDKRDRKFIDGREAVTGMHCANDRSRWAAVVALVNYGTWEIDEVDRLRGSRGNWGTIDKVYHSNSEGEEHFYSSKPPLFSLLIAAQYWLVHQGLGFDLLKNPLWIIKSLVFLNHGLLFGAMIWAYLSIAMRFIERRGVVICLGLALGFCTFLSTFAVSLNNHLPAAACVLASLCVVIRIVMDKRDTPLNYFLVGFLSALTVTFELPALAFLGLIGLWMLTHRPGLTMACGVPGVLVVTVCFLGTNYWVHESIWPPYAHRSDGAVVELIDADDAATLISGRVPESMTMFSETMPGMGDFLVESHPLDGRWRIYDFQNSQRFALQRVGNLYEIRQWDNWYDYEVNGRPSYWLPGVASGVDQGESSRWLYLFHITFGHHGIFSLTPIWMFSLMGIAVAWRDPEIFWRRLAIITLVITVVLLAFYAFRPIQDRNYGGVASGFRWFFWMTPLMLMMLVPAWKIMKRSLLLMFLWFVGMAISFYSATHGFLNPWQHPWPFSDT